MNVRLTQIDGKLPNLALMKLAHWHRAHGDAVHYSRHTGREVFETTAYDCVYGSAIFSASKPAVDTFLKEWPGAIIGGTGTPTKVTVEDVIGQDYEHYDYSIDPGYKFSIGFTQRGCRLKCGFCVVPEKEGRPRTVNTISSIWRGAGHPRAVVLLDNDFFGQPREEWRRRIAEIKDGKFKVSFNQGLNVRLLDEEACAALATIPYYDDQFTTRRLYTAWDNLKDEGIFFNGVDMLERAGIPPRHLMVYMLVGYDQAETWARIFERFDAMVARGIQPYPMVYNNARKDLKWFQRWVVRRFYLLKNKDGSQRFPWKDFTLENLARYKRDGRQDPDQLHLTNI